MYFNITLT